MHVEVTFGLVDLPALLAAPLESPQLTFREKFYLCSPLTMGKITGYRLPRLYGRVL